MLQSAFFYFLDVQRFVKLRDFSHFFLIQKMDRIYLEIGSILFLVDYVSFQIRHFGYVIERWGAGVETQKNVRGEIGGWGRVPFNETYAPSLSTIYDGA